MVADNSLAELNRAKDIRPTSTEITFPIPGRTETGQPMFMILPYERVVDGKLSRNEAISVMQAAEFGAFDLEVFLPEGTAGNLAPQELIATRGVLRAAQSVFSRLRDTIGQLPSEDVQQEREKVAVVFTTFKRSGLLNPDLLIQSLEAEFLKSQGAEQLRQETIAKRNRLAGLGFHTGFQETIIAYRNLDGWIEFPHVDYTLAAEVRWSDAVKKAEELGFLFDEQGRVSGFKPKDGSEIKIPEADRTDQIKVR